MLSNQEAEAIIREGVAALRQGQAAEARRCFERVTEAGRSNAQVWLLLATACRSVGDRRAEEAALDRLLAAEPKTIRALILKGDCRATAGDEEAAARFYRSALVLAEGQQLPGDLTAAIGRAEQALAAIDASVERVRDEKLASRGFPADARSPRFQQSLDIAAGRKRLFLQEPTAYYFPGLPQVEFYERDQFNWADSVEAETDAIRTELQAVLDTGLADFRPYIQSDPNRPRLDDNVLLDSNDWSALFLCENGIVSEAAIARCPRTWAAVQNAPIPVIGGAGPTVMFSLLRAGAHIAPHTGMFNTRLTCHLPLVVPPGCGFRVGSEVRDWEVGKLLIFDDTMEHEAWNRGRDDRVVLIFDIWRPELGERERQEVTALFESSGMSGGH